ncbi:hypothetical protein SAMN05878443_2426 [Carnobacterium alterfunditum]|uniref:Uncharacterized protein n=1 Tax=Carnobacterium alterfunditum TaxID=28230 RepID=A0A1N6IMQ5_9LACT|nr:hypothetical protein [Carnobacterium alterfunditum]SIO33309.1 hypothetical protein SAMN05878443_2426 [Carnobacterium alterfunditum]
MKKIVLSLLIGSTLGGTILQPAVMVYASENNHEPQLTQTYDSGSKVMNKEALTIYKDLIKNQPGTTDHARSFSAENTGDLPEEFNDFKLLENTTQENIETIYTEGNEETQTIVNYNVDSDTYSLFEANMSTGELIVVINDKPE